MKRWNLVALLGLSASLLCGCASDDLSLWHTNVSAVRTHRGDDIRWADPSWDDSGWRAVPTFTVGSYNQTVWLRARIDGAALDGHTEIAIAAIGAYEVFWNGKKVGGNGKPGTSREDEVPGPIETVLSVPSALVASGENVLAVRLSSFHLMYQNRSTVHMLYVGEHADPTAWRLRRYLPGFIASGALFLGACYFAGMFLSDRRDRSDGYLALLFLAALAQFIAEVSRAFVNYAYPLHGVRHGAMLAMACLFGFALVAYVTERLAKPKQRVTLFAAFAVTAFAIAVARGFDDKIASPIVIGALVSFGLAAIAKPLKPLILFAPAALLVWFVAARVRFLDESFYLIVAITLLILFFDQVQHFRAVQRKLQDARLVSSRLELELIKRHIQPHFLMNTLTTLSELIESNPKAGVQMIDALAEEFRLLATISVQRTIPLRDELALCKLHLHIMSLRKEAAFSILADVDESIRLPPATLHTLIENALTHNHYPKGAAFKLRERTTKSHRSYELESPPGDPSRSSGAVSKGSGSGLAYVRARLAEAFGEDWRVEEIRSEAGAWITRIDVPRESPCTF